MTSLMGRTHDKTLVQLAGHAHLAGKPNGVLAAALMAQMELDYSQRVAESGNSSISCILTTMQSPLSSPLGGNTATKCFARTQHYISESRHSLPTHTKAHNVCIGRRVKSY